VTLLSDEVAANRVTKVEDMDEDVGEVDDERVAAEDRS